MPWLPLYIDESDASKLTSLLSNDPEVAFIVSAGRGGKWIAQKGIDSVADYRYCLWHCPSGPLPLLDATGMPHGVIADPWAGWKELRAGADPRVPFFGAGHPGVIWWNVRTQSRCNSGIGLSSFEWIGNHYRILGNSAHPTTEAWWKRLRRLVKNQGAVRVPRAGPLDGPGAEIWSFPSALDKIRAGMWRDV